MYFIHPIFSYISKILPYSRHFLELLWTFSVYQQLLIFVLLLHSVSKDDQIFLIFQILLWDLDLEDLLLNFLPILKHFSNHRVQNEFELFLLNLEVQLGFKNKMVDNHKAIRIKLLLPTTNLLFHYIFILSIFMEPYRVEYR